jgi:hypothetical protein
MGSYKGLGISELAEEIFAAQGKLCCMESDINLLSAYILLFISNI